MKSKEKLDVEIQEAQETLEKLLADGREQRRVNDLLHADNRKVKKKSRAIADKTKDCFKQLTEKKASLKTLSDEAKKINNAISREQKNIREQKRALKDGQDKLTEDAATLERLTKDTDRMRATAEEKQKALKLARQEFEKYKEMVLQKEKSNDKMANDLAVKIEGANALNDTRKDMLQSAERERDKAAEALEDANKVKEQYLTKITEVDNLKKETEALNDNIRKTQKELDAIAEDNKKENEALKKANDRILAKEKGLARRSKDLNIRAQEIETEALRVKKLIRDKQVGKDLAKMKKELK